MNVVADIADVSVEQAKGRYEEMKDRNRRNFFFPAEFIVADSTKVRNFYLKGQFKNWVPHKIVQRDFYLTTRIVYSDLDGGLKPSA